MAAEPQSAYGLTDTGLQRGLQGARVSLPLLCDNPHGGSQPRSPSDVHCRDSPPALPAQQAWGPARECAFLIRSQAVWTLQSGDHAWRSTNLDSQKRWPWAGPTVEDSLVRGSRTWCAEPVHTRGGPSRDAMKSVGPLWGCWCTGAHHRPSTVTGIPPCHLPPHCL